MAPQRQVEENGLIALCCYTESCRNWQNKGLVFFRRGWMLISRSHFSVRATQAVQPLSRSSTLARHWLQNRSKSLVRHCPVHHSRTEILGGQQSRPLPRFLHVGCIPTPRWSRLWATPQSTARVVDWKSQLSSKLRQIMATLGLV